MWLSPDNTEVKKANMSGMFRVNLAFYQNINTFKCVDYDIDFADIKQERARRHPPLTQSIQKPREKAKKSSAQTQLSIPDHAFKEFLSQDGNIQIEVSAGDKQDIQGKRSESTSPDMMSEKASAALTSVDSQLQINVNEASEGEPGTVPIPQSRSPFWVKFNKLHKVFLMNIPQLKGDNILTKSTEVQSASPENTTLEGTDDNVGTKSSEIEKECGNDKSEPNTHSKALHGNPSEEQPSTSNQNPKPKGVVVLLMWHP